MNGIHTQLARHGFVRPTQNRIVGGVCAGIAARYSLDAWAVRVLLVVILLAIPGSQILLYPIAWILMPSEDVAARATASSPVVPPASPAGPQDVVA